MRLNYHCFGINASSFNIFAVSPVWAITKSPFLYATLSDPSSMTIPATAPTILRFKYSGKKYLNLPGVKKIGFWTKRLKKMSTST